MAAWAKRTLKNLRVKTSPNNVEYKITGMSENPCTEWLNANDALDKLRFISVTAPELMEGAPELYIRIQIDQENGIITLTIAKMLVLTAIRFVNLVSNFIKLSWLLISPKSDKQYVWEGEANSNSYIVREETDPEKLIPRGEANSNSYIVREETDPEKLIPRELVYRLTNETNYSETDFTVVNRCVGPLGSREASKLDALASVKGFPKDPKDASSKIEAAISPSWINNDEQGSLQRRGDIGTSLQQSIRGRCLPHTKKPT
ncbi:Heat shock protein Hsp90 [Artemisia annua]|uniref:Heat shock protein Hsp90 n=1 Tax=Artemisia annua TaxID=35608 RepID=A0A2U1L3A3_ARTAN|nr:Heat shock protein Hsp90 [Artemisia annua]